MQALKWPQVHAWRLAQVLGREPMTREDLATAVAREAGVPHLRELILASNWGSPLKPSAFRGDLCFGPNQRQHVTFVNPRAWLGDWPTIEPLRAFQEIARLSCHSSTPIPSRLGTTASRCPRAPTRAWSFASRGGFRRSSSSTARFKAYGAPPPAAARPLSRFTSSPRPPHGSAKGLKPRWSGWAPSSRRASRWPMSAHPRPPQRLEAASTSFLSSVRGSRPVRATIRSSSA